MRISVIIPTYNRAELLREALNSVLMQTITPLEIIVVDDGSIDHTQNVLAEFGDRVKTIRLGRSGISTARNAGIDASTGTHIAFLDSDDLWLPTKLEKQLDFATNHPDTALTYTDAIQFTKNGTEKKSFVDNFPSLNDTSHLFTKMITDFAVPLTSTVMVKASVLRDSGLRFPSEIGIGEDLGLFLKILMAGGRFGYLPEKLTMRRMHDSNVSGDHCRRFQQRKLLYTNLLQDTSHRYTSEQKSALTRGLRDARYRVGECLWERLDLQNARNEFFHAIAPDGRGARAIAYGLLAFLPAKFIVGMRNRKASQ